MQTSNSGLSVGLDIPALGIVYGGSEDASETNAATRVCISIYTYIYIERHVHMYVYIYIHVYL